MSEAISGADLAETETLHVASLMRATNLPPLAAPRVGNAVFKLTGKRFRALTVSPERVKAVTGFDV